MKGRFQISIILIVIILASLVGAVVVGAQTEKQILYPSFELVDDDGNVVELGWASDDWIYVGGDLERCCGGQDECTSYISSTSVPNGTTEPRPTDKPRPTDVPPTGVPPTEVPPTSVPPTPKPEKLFCHCEQGEGEGAEGYKNCHIAKYNNGHAKHEWDYWSTTGYCDGWHH